VRADRNRGIVARAGKFSAYLYGAGGRQCVGTADPPAFMRYARSVLISPIFDLNPLERARTELKLAPGFLVRSAPNLEGEVCKAFVPGITTGWETLEKAAEQLRIL
jgi:hypothetical protein